MVSTALKTPFPWYDNINKQNRYNGACEAVCNFKLLTPLNTIPPFIIRTNENYVEIISWKVYCAEDGSLADDITAAAVIGNELPIATIDGQDYIIYNGNQIVDGPQVHGLVLSCGTYYSVIETNVRNYYSELFYCQDDVEDADFSQIDFPLWTAWRWYDDQQKQNRFKGACEANCNFYLITGNDALLPFMFRKPSVSNTINSWVLRDVDGTCEHNLDPAILQATIKDSHDYIIYNGDAIADLPCGIFESIITINGVSYYSELIQITNEISTNETFFILQESGDLLLQENSDKLIQEQNG